MRGQFEDLLPCYRCKALNLTYDSFVIDQNAKTISATPRFWKARSMGFFEEIYMRSTKCGLCKLLVDSLRQGPSETEIPIDIEKEAECFLSWKVDGRERIAGASDNATVNRHRTRRLAIDWHTPQGHIESSYIVLVAPNGSFVADGVPIDSETNKKSTLFLGRKLTSLPANNITLVKEWLALCQSAHEDCKINRNEVRYRDLVTQTWFQVINVERMNLCELPDGEPYLALSYTWGDRPVDSDHIPAVFKATHGNINQLWKDNAIGNILEDLPQAIRNAIALTQLLGYSYIWIDSLCIVQDNDMSWFWNSRYMDAIYGHAELTICSADGNGADVGLSALFTGSENVPAGAYRPSSAKQLIRPYDPSKPEGERLELMLSWSSESYIKSSRWNKRAWTFQERMISPRCLICVSDRVYFQCQTAVLSEDIFSDTKTKQGTAGWSLELFENPARTLRRLPTDPIGVFKDCLAMYTKRQLSHEEDVLSAFTGIGNFMTQFLGHADDIEEESTLVFGLPASHFDYALLWQPEEPSTRRILENSDKVFPSWSWSGWRCPSGMSYRPAAVDGPEVDLHKWFQCHTWITWYIRNSSGQLRLVWDPERYKPFKQIPPEWKGYNSPKGGWPSATNDLEPVVDFHGRPYRDNEFPRRGRTHQKGLPGKQAFDIIVPPFMRGNRLLQPGTKKQKVADTKGDLSLLQFFTFYGRFQVHVDAEENPTESRAAKQSARLQRHAVLDRHGDFAGVVWLDMAEPSGRGEDHLEEFIAISEAKSFDKTEDGCWNAYVEDERSMKSWQLYNVLMINRSEADGNGTGQSNIWYRTGLGKIYKKAFELAYPAEETGDRRAEEKFPIWKEIVLG